ncbi:MAG TPA: hypothetical protein VFP55_04850 [Solirubrobacteraceae bacterium]|nr:hypothetical protein [Solirubrobacteraceae bacterium]
MSARPGDGPEPLGILLLPAALEAFELADHARELLAIPRVIALEPSRHRTPRPLRDAVPLRQARRLRFPGSPRLLVLYHAEQYRLARALMARYGDAELWYVERELETRGEESAAPAAELRELDELARERATPERTLVPRLESALAGSPLRVRLQELGIISSHPFVPLTRGRRVSR